MRFGKATAAGSRRKHLPRPPRLPRVHPPRLHQPAVHVTALVGVAAVVSAFAAATPSLQGSFVGGNTNSRPAAVVGQASTGDGVSPATNVLGDIGDTGTPTFSTTVAPPPNTTVGTGPGNIATVLFSTPNSGTALASPLASDGIPVTALEAYQDAANSANAGNPNCHIPWPLLAGIGRVESDHGRYGGAVLRPDGSSTKPIIGIPLNGKGTEVVSDTDGGSVDGDPVYDRAVGPMQFIPSTWQIYGADGNGDGIKDPFNIFDAALAAADYLCVAGGNLATTAGQTRAVLTYNHSTAYLNEVLSLEHTYASGDPGLIIPDPPATVPPLPTEQPGGQPVPPPVDPGPPLGVPTPTHQGGGSGGATHHHPSPHPTSTVASGGGSSTTAGDGGTPPADPSGSTSTDPGSGPGSGTSSSGDPSSSTSDPGPSDTTTPNDPGTPSDPPSCPATSTGAPSDTPTSANPPSDATVGGQAAQLDTGATPAGADLSTDSPASAAAAVAAADTAQTAAAGGQTSDPAGCS